MIIRPELQCNCQASQLFLSSFLPTIFPSVSFRSKRGCLVFYCYVRSCPQLSVLQQQFLISHGSVG